MLVEYTYAVKGYLKLGPTFGFRLRDREFEFRTDEDGFLIALVVKTTTDAESAPRLEQKPGEVAQIIIPDDGKHSLLQEDLRTLEGLLSLYGLHKLVFDQPEARWIPENEKDKDLLRLESFKLGRVDPRELVNKALDSSLVVQSTIAASSAAHVQVPLSFFRKGNIDLDEGRFVDAFYDYYFVIEHLYADGKFKSTQVREKLKASRVLLTAISEAQADKRFPYRGPQEEAYHHEKYLSAQPEAVVDHIVELRGKLHHHSAKRASWHPAKEERYRIDAFFLQAVTFSCCYRLAEPHVFAAETVEECRKLAAYREVEQK